jgi:hypothetical protein
MNSSQSMVVFDNEKFLEVNKKTDCIFQMD